MEIHEAADMAHSTALPWAPIMIMPIGDIQYSGSGGPSDLNRLKKQLAWGVENKCYYIGMGDYIDFLSPSNRARLKASGLYDTAEDVIDQAATTLENELFKVLAPTRGRWITLVEGHHYYHHMDGTTTGQRMATFLGAKYGGDAVLTRVTFRKSETNHASVSTKLFIHHGVGSSSTLSGPLPRMERFAARCLAQVFFIGHYHTQDVKVFDALDISDHGMPHLTHVTRCIVQTGSFMHGWQQGSHIGGRPSGHYPEQKLLAPVTLGAPVVILTPVITDRIEEPSGRRATHASVTIGGFVGSMPNLEALLKNKNI